MDWTASGTEIIAPYQKVQKELYIKEDPNCIIPMWSPKVGIHRKDGNFAAMVVRKFFENQGYSVLPNYLLIRCPRKRESNAGFHFLNKVFGNDKIRLVMNESKKNDLRGGDPDLFVFNEKQSKFFFAEAKDRDKLTKNQKVLFPIIRKYLCRVVVVRIRPI